MAMVTDPSIISKPAYYLIILLTLSLGFFPALAQTSMICIGLLLVIDLIHQKTFVAIRQPLLQEIGVFAALILVSFIADMISGNSDDYPFFIFSLAAYFFGAIYAYSDDRRRIILWSIIIGAVIASCLKLIGHLNLGFNTFVDKISIESDLEALNTISLCVIISLFSYSRLWAERICLLLMSLPAFLILLYSNELILILMILVLIIIMGVIKSKALWLFILLIALIFAVTPVGGYGDLYRNLIDEIKGPFLTAGDNLALLESVSYFGVLDSISSRQLNILEQWPFAFRLILFYGPLSFLIFIWIFYTQIRRYIGRLRLSSTDQNGAYQYAGFLISLLILTACFYSESFELFPAGVLTCLIWGITES